MGPELVFGFTVIKYALKYGIPAVMNILDLWRASDPTMTDIKALKTMVPPTSTYFQKKGE